MSDKQTEVEFAGVKFRGGKIFAVILALSTLSGSLYGAFEFYKDYMNMKDKIESYVAPDLSGFDKRLAVLLEELSAIKEISAAHVEIIEVYGSKLDFMQDGVQGNESANRAMKTDMRNDLTRIEGIVEKVEDDIQEVEADVRVMITNAEERAENKRDALQNDYDQARDRLRIDTERKLKELEARLNKRLQRALDNPLAN
jgi:DNA repair exonuclease SbcCD ATPase subunit